MGDLLGILRWDMAAFVAAFAAFLVWILTARPRHQPQTEVGTVRGNPNSKRTVESPLRRFETKLMLIGVGFAAVLFGGVFAISQASGALEVSTPLRVTLGLVWLIGLPIALCYLRYPGSLKLSHSLIIHASPEMVWNTVSYRPTTDYYRATVARIVRKSTEAEIYDVHLRDLGVCPECDLHKSPDCSAKKMTVEIIERNVGSLERTRTTLAPSRSRPVILEEQSEWRISPHPDGSLVTRSGITTGPLLWNWVMARIKASNSARDSLIALKSYLEGTRGTGSFAAAQEMLDAARAAPRHCRCG